MTATALGRLFRGLAGRRRRGGRAPAPRFEIDIENVAVYAVGDVHGCLDHLLGLERMIAADAAAIDAPKLIVMLGDYVDRGPASAGVLDHIQGRPPAGFQRLCLLGNHEMAMLDYLEGRIALGTWMALGAGATLHSYGIDPQGLRNMYGSEAEVDAAIRAAVPVRHATFLRGLPILLDSGRHLFVHAGIRPERALDEQTDEDLVTIRDAFFDSPAPLPRHVIHGHTPINQPKFERGRINLDTGAVFSGRLSALRIHRGRGKIIAYDHHAARPPFSA